MTSRVLDFLCNSCESLCPTIPLFNNRICEDCLIECLDDFEADRKRRARGAQLFRIQLSQPYEERLTDKFTIDLDSKEVQG